MPTNPKPERETVCPDCTGDGIDLTHKHYMANCKTCNGTGRVPADTDTVMEDE